MEQLPIYVSIVFILTALLTAVLLYKATNYSKPIIIITVLWLVFQAVLGLSGFYTVTTGLPPRFSLVIMPPVIFIAVIFLTKKGRGSIDDFDIKTLTILHVVRIPVELTLYWLFLHKAVPEIMTFEGRNFDIFCGLTAPVIYYFAYVKNAIGKKMLMAWNVICLLLLANIVVTAVLSAPLRFQQFGFEQPNIALFYFPFVWLPGFVVPAVLFAHLVNLRRLMK
jgi:heme A synthase